MPTNPPELDTLRETALLFNGFVNVDKTWLQLVDDTKPAMDLSLPDHRTMLLRWLNSWGCRIRYPRPGEPSPFDSGVMNWWESWSAALPDVSLARLTDESIDTTASAYAELAALPVANGKVRRTLGPTAAAKALYAMRPNAIMPWDAAIAAQLHGSRDGAAFGRHLRLGREWAVAVIAEAGTGQAGGEDAGGEEAIGEIVGRPGISLAKILDEYLYVTITMRSAQKG